jgi:hypothetical protein
MDYHNRERDARIAAGKAPEELAELEARMTDSDGMGE